MKANTRTAAAAAAANEWKSATKRINEHEWQIWRMGGEK